jgi:dihydropteroate synthase
LDDAELGVPIILMHMRGTPETVQQLTNYDDVLTDVSCWNDPDLAKRMEFTRGYKCWVLELDLPSEAI